MKFKLLINGILLTSFFMFFGCYSQLNKVAICNLNCKIGFLDDDNLQIIIENNSSHNINLSLNGELNMTLCVFENKTFSDKLFLGCAKIKEKSNMIISPHTTLTKKINLRQIEFGNPVYKTPRELGGIMYLQKWEDIKKEPIEKCAFLVIERKRKSEDNYKVLEPYWFKIFSNTVKCPISNVGENQIGDE